MIDGKKFFDKSVKNDTRTYDNIRQVATCQGVDYKNFCLLNYVYFEKYIIK